MKKLNDLGELIPALVVLVFIVALAGLVFQLALAAIKGAPADPVATGVLGTILGACIPAMVGLYIRDSKPVPPGPPSPPPARPPVERTGDPEADQWNEDHGWLQLVRRRGYRWSL